MPKLTNEQGQAEAQEPDVCAISSGGGVPEAEWVYTNAVLKIKNGGGHARRRFFAF